MTRMLLSRLQKQLKELEYELKTKLPEEIRRAAALGDLSENAEYEAALDRQRLLQSRHRTMKHRINEIAMIDIDRLPKDKIGYGSVVVVLDLNTDDEHTYQLVMPEDASAENGRISISSPIGKSLLGKVDGDEVRIQIPSGVREYEIMAFKPYASTAQDL